MVVWFAPGEAEAYSRTVYCDVTGRESRLALRLQGEGVGPCVALSLTTLQLGSIFLDSHTSFKVCTHACIATQAVV